MVSNIYIRFIFIPVRVFTDIDFNKNNFDFVNGVLNLTFEKISECKPSTLIECGSSFSLTDIVRPMLPKEWKCLDFRDLLPNEAKIHEAK